MELKKLQGAIEAILFASGEPVSLDRISEALDVDKLTVSKLLQKLMGEYNQPDRGIRLIRLEDSYQMCTNSQYGGKVRAALEIKRNAPLSQAAMEVLAVVAYNQPVTKAFVEQVRGVDCSGVIGSLMSKGLLEERGRLELPGRPLLYGTTPNFLRCFGISSPEDLPPLPQKTSGQEEDRQTDLHSSGEEECGEE